MRVVHIFPQIDFKIRVRVYELNWGFCVLMNEY